MKTEFAVAVLVFWVPVLHFIHRKVKERHER